MERILLAFDGSEPGCHAAARAAELASRLGAELTVLVVGELIEAGYGAVAPLASEEELQAVVDEGVRRAALGGVTAAGQLAWGHAADEIVDIARRGEYGMIVVGHRGRGGLRSLLLGSVAKQVIDHAPCSVLVVR